MLQIQDHKLFTIIRWKNFLGMIEKLDTQKNDRKLENEKARRKREIGGEEKEHIR